MTSELTENDFPRLGGPAEQLRFALRYAVLAPSSHNAQPWHFVVQHDSVLVCADRMRALPVSDPHDRELIISCGAALFNLRVALAHFECSYRVTLFPYQTDPDVLAEVRLGGPGFHDAALAALFPALARRRTNRNDFGPDTVPATLLEELARAADAEGASLACFTDEHSRERLAELVAEGDRIQFSESSFRRELAAWIHPARRGDGMPAYAPGMNALLDFARPVATAVIRTFDVGGGIAASHKRLAQGSPVIACLSAAKDVPESWLAAGQALERVLLVATYSWFDASFLNQPIEVPTLRSRLQQLVGTGELPQILLRLGSGLAPQRAPRRPVEAVLW